MVTVALWALAENAKTEGTNWILVHQTKTHKVYWAEWDKNYWDKIYVSTKEEKIEDCEELIRDYPDGATIANYKVEKLE